MQGPFTSGFIATQSGAPEDNSLSGPNWDRPIWLAFYRPKSGTLRKSLAENTTFMWSIDPFSPDEFQRMHEPGDPVVLLQEPSEDDRGGMIATAVSGVGTAALSLQILNVLTDSPIGYDELPQILRMLVQENSPKRALWRLDEKESRQLRDVIRKTIGLSVTGTIPRDATKKKQAPRKTAKIDPKRILDPKPEAEAEAGSAPSDTAAPEDTRKPATPTPASPIHTKTEFSHDRPTSVIDQLKRAPNAFVIAQYLNRLRGKPDSTQEHDSYILHVDAPWGGGKTTFANFIANFLSYARHQTPKDQMEFIKTSGVKEDRLAPMADNRWMILRFNAWENQHVTPPWWNFYTSFLNGYQANIEHPYGFDLEEYSWRIFTPDTLKSMALAVFLALIALVLASFGAFARLDPLITSAAAILGATSFLAYVFTTAKSGMKRIIDAAGSAYDPTVLGEEDPLVRLRKRFLKVAGYQDRPVLMIIDDIDRCEPDYVVELMRGLITIFQSNHVSYLILGDRGWIEQSFEHVMEDMRDAHTDTTVSFGARFAEKAIQMSYLLPQVPDTERQSYLRSLLGDNPQAAAQVETLKAELQQSFATAKSSADVSRAVQSLKTAQSDPATREAWDEALRTQAAIARAVVEDRDETIRHGLEEVWQLLPENPRRVKRLVNMIAVYQASAETTLGIDPDTREDWLPMVLWLILFSEFPAVFEAIHRDPDLLAPLPAPDETLLRLDWKLPGGVPKDARAVIDGVGRDQTRIRLTPAIATHLRQLTPLL